MHAQVLDKFIAKQGSTEGGEYFLGGRFSYAEVCTVPFLRRAVVMLGEHRGFNIPAIVKAKGLKRLEAWMQVPWACPVSACAAVLWPDCALACAVLGAHDCTHMHLLFGGHAGKFFRSSLHAIGHACFRMEVRKRASVRRLP